jgi:hypothetical protein
MIQNQPNTQQKTGVGRPGYSQNQRADFTAVIDPKLAAEIILNQAQELESVARGICQQGFQTFDFDLLRRAARVAVVAGTLYEKLGARNGH